jgi:hypothetical protein
MSFHSNLGQTNKMIQLYYWLLQMHLVLYLDLHILFNARLL